MEEIKLKGLNESIYHDVCDNGLNIYIWTSKKAQSFQGTMNVFYGGDGISFSVKNKSYQVHRGSAHYLEHIMCTTNDGGSLLSKFNELGSSSNAYTNYLHTAYEFVGTKQLKENILLLLEALFEKKFDEVTFEKERTPILEEQRMRLDNAGIVSYITLNDMLFQKYPCKTDLIGSKEDIQAISLKELDLLYQTFYHPENMAFVVTGNVDAYEVVKIVKEYFKTHEVLTWQKPKIKTIRENKKVNLKRKEIHLNVEVPELCVAVKLSMNLFKGYDTNQLFCMIRVVLASNFGSTSLLKEELLEKKLIYNLGFTAYEHYDYLILEVECRTNYPEEMEQILVDRLSHLEINQADIERKIKSALATLVLSYEDIEDVNALINRSLVYDKKIIDNEKELLESIKIEEIEALFQQIKMKEVAVLVTYPKE